MEVVLKSNTSLMVIFIVGELFSFLFFFLESNISLLYYVLLINDEFFVIKANNGSTLQQRFTYTQKNRVYRLGEIDVVFTNYRVKNTNY
jgi:hypothetical protein